MNISLTPELEQFINEKVNSGKYPSASEVVQAALRLLEERERLYQEKLTELQAKIDEGIASLERGEGIDGETALQQLRTNILTRAQQV
jgi:antitoxin ParD1/3/4